jgi:3-methyladenine DNA glycosylase AlkD
MKAPIQSPIQSILPIFELRQILTEYAQPEKKEGMQAYMKNLFPFLGVSATARKAAFKQFLTLWHPQNKQELKQWIVVLWNEPEREFQYFAMEFISKYIKWFDHSDIPFIKELILQKSWWDTVDMLAGSYLGNILIKHMHALPQIIEEFTGDTNMWVNRSAIICQLKFRDKTNTDWLEFSILPHMNSKEFFHQKAIGWALRQYAKSNPNWVIDFVRKYPLKPLSKREALKHL